MGQLLCSSKNNQKNDFNQNKENNLVSNALKEKDDKSNDHTIKMISLVDKFVHSVCIQKVKAAKQYAKALSSFNHPNIAKYIDECQTNSNYFIKIEKYESTLFDFIQKTPLQIFNEQQYIEFALQLLHAIKFLHQNQYFLRYISLKDILIDNNKQIKLYEFDSAHNITINQALNFLESQAKDSTFYLPPEFLELSSQGNSGSTENQNIQGDIWLFGISMYILAGADFSHAKQFTKGVESYQIKNTISLEINLILLDILIRNPKLRPSIDDIIERFKYLKIKKEIQKEKRLFEFVQQCFDDFEFKVSFKYLEKLIEMNPSNDQYIAMKGRAYLEIDKIDEAKSLSLKCLEMNPQNQLAMSNLGYCQYRNYEYEKSLEYIDKCLSINSNNYLALNYKAYLLDQKKQYDDAIKIHRQVLEINPNYIHALTGIGQTYQIQEQYDQAIDFYKKALQIKSDHIDAIHKLGAIYSNKGMYDLALDYLQKGLETEPNSSRILNELGQYYENQDQIDKAIDYYNKCLQVDPKNNYSCLQLGSIYLNQEKFDLALKFYQKYHQILPKSKIANKQIGDIYFKKQDYQKCIYYYKQEIKVNPDNYLTINILGVVYNVYSMKDKALEYIKKANKLNPNEEVIRQNLEKIKKEI